MKLLRDIHIGSNIPNVRHIKSARLVEGIEPFSKYVNMAYREQRNLIEEFEPNSDKAKYAARQARLLLSMQPQVLTGDMKGVKDLAIKLWNESFTRIMKDIALAESRVKDEIDFEVKDMLDADELETIKDLSKKDQVLEMGKVLSQKVIKSAVETFRVVLYSLRGERFVAVENPGSKIDLFTKV